MSNLKKWIDEQFSDSYNLIRPILDVRQFADNSSKDSMLEACLDPPFRLVSIFNPKTALADTSQIKDHHIPNIGLSLLLVLLKLFCKLFYFLSFIGNWEAESLALHELHSPCEPLVC